MRRWSTAPKMAPSATTWNFLASVLCQEPLSCHKLPCANGFKTKDSYSRIPSISWEGMDDMNFEKVFISRTPMLKSCKRRFGSCSALSRSCCSTNPRLRKCGGKQELVERANKSGRGWWRELLASSQEVPSHPHPKRHLHRVHFF